MKINLIRTKREGKAVRGMMRVGGRDIETLENADYIIPDGTYQVSATYSPRFKKMMPLIGNVPASPKERETVKRSSLSPQKRWKNTRASRKSDASAKENPAYTCVCGIFFVPLHAKRAIEKK